MSDPFAADGPPTKPTHPDATGVYTDTSFTYDSSIDAGVTGLFARVTWDHGVAAANLAAGRRMPVAVLMHGYTGDANSFDHTDRERYASYGLVVVVIGLRGNNGATGARDASGRETRDIRDAVDAVRATYPLVASQTVAVAPAYSGGGGNVALCMVRDPELFSVYGLFFPVWDYGRWYTYQPSQAPALLDVDIGGSPTAFPREYATRYSPDAVGDVMVCMGADGPFVYLFDSPADIIIDPATHAAFVAGLVARGVSTDKYAWNEDVAWVHDYPSSAVGLQDAEDYFGRRMAHAAEVTMPAQGAVQVLGWIEWGPWEIWLSDAADPRATGGLNRTASLTYDTAAGTCTITPHLGITHVYVRHGAHSLEYVSNNTCIIDVAAGTVDEIRSDLPSPPVASAAGPVQSGPASFAAGLTPTPPVAWTPPDPRPRVRLAL